MHSALFCSSRKTFALLTLCAITAPTSSAWAEPARASDPIASVSTALMNDEDHSESAASADTAYESGVAHQGGAVPAPTKLTAAFLAPALQLDAAHPPLASLSLAPLSVAAPREEASPAPPERASAPSAPAGADDGSGLRTAGWIAGGVGLAGLALFAIAGLGAKSAYDKLAADCGTTACTDEAHHSDIEGGRMLQTTANIGLAAGLTGLGVGATLLVLGSRSPLDRRTPSDSVSASGAMLTYGGRF